MFAAAGLSDVTSYKDTHFEQEEIADQDCVRNTITLCLGNIAPESSWPLGKKERGESPSGQARNDRTIVFVGPPSHSVLCFASKTGIHVLI